MSSLKPKSTATVFVTAAALALGCGLGTAAAAPSSPAPSLAPSPVAAAAPACGSATVSGRTVSGALPAAEVHRQLDSLTRQHRSQYGTPSGIAAKGPLGTASPATGTVVRPLLDIHPAQGTAFKSLSGSDGSCATQSVSTQLTVHDSGTTIYTPTMYPAGGSCVELVTVYTRTVRSVSAWDWCRSVNFAASVTINSSFLTTYTGGTGSYTGRVVKTSAASNTWSADLYNYSTGQWDTLFAQSGANQSGRTDGWDIEELYSTVGTSGQASSCADMANLTFESANIAVRTNGTWSPASTANADTHYDSPAGSFYCPTRTFQMLTPYTHWKATG
ncbi:hypothetical protein [Streptomyces sp. NPDC008317]|uniref:hypothetical protein n=1 Tax=Streptomyces sp. NPDC008317 TaxID=3364827 RepID=UPI0036EF3B35